MTTINMKLLNAIAVSLSVSMLSACGDSDLEEIHEQELDDAIVSFEAPLVSSALPNSESITPANIDLSDYELVFGDEFNDMTLDANKWTTSLWPEDTIVFNQLQFYVDIQNDTQTLNSPFTLNGQYLTISATPTPDDQRSIANEQAYLSGILSTRDTFDLTFGYIEARVDVETGRGIWPSLWMFGSASDGLRPELYLLEHDGAKADSIFYNYNYVDNDGNLRSTGQREVEFEGFADSFHTIGLKWTSEEILFYINGQPSYRIVGQNVPNEDMFLILNLAMGGIWPGAPDATTPDPATFKVDYIRVYQLKDQ